MVILGHNIKAVESPVPLESPASKASLWSIREKIRHFEVNALDRTTLFEPFVHLCSKLNQPPNKSGFHQLSMVRKSVKTDSWGQAKFYISSYDELDWNWCALDFCKLIVCVCEIPHNKTGNEFSVDSKDLSYNAAVRKMNNCFILFWIKLWSEYLRSSKAFYCCKHLL